MALASSTAQAMQPLEISKRFLKKRFYMSEVIFAMTLLSIKLTF